MKIQHCAALLLWLAAAVSSHGAVTIDYVTVGDVGNANDSTGYGGVGYSYQISKYEVTNAQYAEFLNATAATDTNSLYSSSMNIDARGGITQSGVSGSFTYSLKADMGDKPVIYVSFSDAMRFSNWMHNGQGGGSTESGAYDMTQSVSTVIHGGSASVWLPTENEWYKAAYYQPVGAGGPSDSYWLYPTRSDTVPTIAAAGTTGIISNPGTNVANYSLGADWNAQNGNVTTVGSAGSLSASYYGTFDQGGNVWEWNEAVIVSARGLRGGSRVPRVQPARLEPQPQRSRGRELLRGLPSRKLFCPRTFSGDDVASRSVRFAHETSSAALCPLKLLPLVALL